MTDKKIVDDDRQKYVEITKNCLGIEIVDERLRFLQTIHLQCRLHDLSIQKQHSWQLAILRKQNFV